MICTQLKSKVKYDCILPVPFDFSFTADKGLIYD